eukprot:CAMPEP_0119340704 /NCGR_PEP_ID=MMETSP1333-20130426/100852_1 /TAXON_ID=418940 /ORGANISM="Scyphosphaera apsteinii, Strain RCC1455" /LENGTH=279 /DNA_ID=CAMNT_0007352513 /DNA_START=64 /DNA_END=903 /DNA_ORIENTATION=+
MPPKKILGLQKGEVHKEKFDDDSDRFREARGYMVVLGCNLLSCCSLVLYLFGVIDAAGELQCEAIFLIIKGVIEVLTGKFGWALLLHHTAMIGGFLLNQHASMQCWSFITVHQQFVHFPFAIRAAWRLTLPAMGYIKHELSWRRRGLANLFWLTWMFSCGYRTLLITLYSAICLCGPILGFQWQATVGILMALILASLDRNWTKAMWPTKPWPDRRHNAYFHSGTRITFCLGMTFAILALLSDVFPDVLPLWARIVYPGPFHRSTPQCLIETRTLSEAV